MPVVACKTEAEWKAERAKSIGASEVPTVLGTNPFETPLQLYFRKLGLAPEIEESEAMEWGHRLEETLWYKWLEPRHMQTGHSDFPGAFCDSFAIVRRPGTMFMHATPDFPFATTVGDRDIRGVLQVKTVGVHMASHWRDDDGCNVLPANVYDQVQSEIYNTGADCGAVACLIGGQRYLEFDVPRDDEKIAEIIEACREFDRRLREEDPPPATERDLDAVKFRFPDSVDDKTVPLDWECTIDADRWDNAKEMIAFHQKIANETEAHIKIRMGDADKGVLPDGSGFTWRANKRGSRVFRRFKGNGQSDCS